MSIMSEKDLVKAGPNAVVYSEKAWAAARKSTGGTDVWFVDSGSYSRNGGQASSFDLVAWADDWQQLR